jgi:hypothetical protein
MDWRVAGNEAQQSLEDTLARRDSSTRLLMQLSQEAQRRKESERNFALNEEVRKGALARQVKQDATMAEDRDESRKLAKITRTQAGARLIAPGSRITNPQEVADMREAGLGSRLKEIMAETALPNGDAGPVDNRDFVPGQQEFLGTSDQLNDQARIDAAEQRAAAMQAQRGVQNEMANARLQNSQGAADLARERLAFDVDRSNRPPVVRPSKTPAEIQAEAAARSAGTAQGKAAGTPAKRNILSGITDIFSPKPTAAPPTTSAKVRMVAPTGEVMEVSEAEAAHYEARGAKRAQ